MPRFSNLKNSVAGPGGLRRDRACPRKRESRSDLGLYRCGMQHYKRERFNRGWQRNRYYYS